MALPEDFRLDDFVQFVLAEDLGIGGDVTSQATIAAEARFTAEMNCRQAITVAGIEIAAAFFRALDPDVELEMLVTDGDRVDAGTPLMRLRGNAQGDAGGGALRAEHAPASIRHRYADPALRRPDHRDRRDPARHAQDNPGPSRTRKYAARMGGAQNHRMRLDDGVLIKDNHVAVCGGVAEAVRRAREARTPACRCRSKSTASTRSSRRSPPAPTACCSTTCRRRSFARRSTWSRGRVPLEASGGVTLETIRAIAETGVDFISVGRITQSAPAVDIGLDYSVG